MTVITSFYTPDWKYPKFAKQLLSDCEQLGLRHYIVEKESKGDYAKNCNIKPFFIKEMLEKFKKPILWVDVDGSITSVPELLYSDEILQYDVAANRPAWNANKVHVGSMWFNYTKSAADLVDAWCESVSMGGVDDGQFNSIWNKYKDSIRFYELPSKYFVILKSLNSDIPEDSCIVHRISKSDLKKEFKQKLNKNKRKK